MVHHGIIHFFLWSDLISSQFWSYPLSQFWLLKCTSWSSCTISRSTIDCSGISSTSGSHLASGGVEPTNGQSNWKIFHARRTFFLVPKIPKPWKNCKWSSKRYIYIYIYTQYVRFWMGQTSGYPLRTPRGSPRKMGIPIFTPGISIVEWWETIKFGGTTWSPKNPYVILVKQ